MEYTTGDILTPLGGDDILQQILSAAPFSEWRGLRLVCRKWNAHIIKMVAAKKEYIMGLFNQEITIEDIGQKIDFSEINRADTNYISQFLNEDGTMHKRNEYLDDKNHYSVSGFPVSEFISELCLKFPHSPSCKHKMDVCMECPRCTSHAIFLRRAHMSCYTYSFKRLHKVHERAVDIAYNSIIDIVEECVPGIDCDAFRRRHPTITFPKKLTEFTFDKLSVLDSLILPDYVDKVDWLKLMAHFIGHVSYDTDIWVKLIPIIEQVGIKHTPYDKWLSPDFLTALEVYGTEDHTEYIRRVEKESLFYRKGVELYN